MGWRRSIVAAVPADVVDLGLARRLAAVGVDNGHGLGTAALGVLDRGSLGRTLSRVLAGRAIGHAVVELETTVKLGGDGEGVDREVSSALASGDARRCLLLGSAGADDRAASRAKGASTQEVVTLAEVVLAGPAAEVESTKLSELADGEVAKVPATLHVGVAMVVGVSGAAIGRGLSPRASEVELDDEI